MLFKQALKPINDQDINCVIALMHSYMRSANNILPGATYAQIYDAKQNLHIAQGIHMALLQIGVIDKTGGEEDLSRIENKIEDIYEQKRRDIYPRWVKK